MKRRERKTQAAAAAQMRQFSREAFLAMEDFRTEEEDSSKEDSGRINRMMTVDERTGDVPLSSRTKDEHSDYSLRHTIQQGNQNAKSADRKSKQESVSEELQIYIPLEKTYRAELRAITERIGIQMKENSNSTAAKEYVIQNPRAAARAVREQDRQIQNYRTLPTLENSKVKDRLRKISNPETGKQTARSSKLPLRSTGTKSSLGYSSMPADDSQHRQSSSFSSGIKIETQNNLLPQRTKTAQSKRTPKDTGVIPPVLEESITDLEDDTRTASKPAFVRGRRFSIVSVIQSQDTAGLPAPDKNIRRRNSLTTDSKQVTIIHAAAAAPNSDHQFDLTKTMYDARYQMTWQRPWDEETDDPDRNPAEDEPAREVREKANLKCREWLIKYSSTPPRRTFTTPLNG